MKLKLILFLVACCLVVSIAPECMAIPEHNEVEQKALERAGIKGDPRREIGAFVNKHAESESPFASRGNLFFVDSTSLQTTFPGLAFYVLRYPQWPVAFNLPDPLSSNNIFVVDQKSQLRLIVEPKALKELFCTVEAKTPLQAQTALASWLRLSQELHQDGMFKFGPPSDLDVKAGGSGVVATGTIAVLQDTGNTGHIKATLTFDKSGKLSDSSEEVTLKAGMRPICQASKLLDADPIIRRMAEQDLLIMGKYAKPYLDWQRTQLSPELIEAIDKIWKRIEKENRYAEAK